MKTPPGYSLFVLLAFALSIGIAGTACEGPSGSDGEAGEDGPEGPVGPAGENGSMMYADEGEPNEDTGEIGDYYLNQNTGELHGPKNEDGWGEPGIVLIGEDGAEGSQIYSGEGAPDEGLGNEGDYYLDKDSYELYGPKTSDNWGSPLNLKGADGNANVTRYIYPGADFSTGSEVLILDADSETETVENVWLVYLVYEGTGGLWQYYSLPGYGTNSNTLYTRYHYWTDAYNYAYMHISSVDGPGEEYGRIEIIRIEAGSAVDRTKPIGEHSIVPEDLDVSDYDAVAEYYGFGSN